MNKKFDIETAKKLLSIYAENANYYLRENKNLKNQLKDIQTSLEINKELLFKEINKHFNNSDILNNLKKENERLTKKFDNIYKERIDYENKYHKIKDQLDNLLIEKNNLYDIHSTEIFKLNNKIKEKENIIKHLNKELTNIIKDNEITKEIIIIEPNINNLEINNELVETREILNKYTELLQREKQKNKIQEQKISILKKRIINLKKKKKIKEKMENIELFDYILTISSNSSSNSESNSERNSNLNLSLESLVIKFPEKIKQKKYLKTEISNNKFPKLDFSKLKNNLPLKQITIIDNIKETSRKNNEEYIDKLIFQLKFYKNSCNHLKKKNKELKKIVSMLKTNYFNLKNNVYNTNSTQETRSEKNKMFKISSLNNNNIPFQNNNNNNLSMEVNSSQIDIDSINEGSDFNYIIKEYNKSFIVNKN